MTVPVEDLPWLNRVVLLIGKRPALRGWQTEHSSVEEIDAHLARDPTHGVGIRTGDGLMVIDVDPPHGDAQLRSLERTCGAIPPTVTSVTPSDGRHLYLTVDDVVPNSVGRLAPGVDIRGDGGLVVIPPSPGYRWLVAPTDTVPARLPVSIAGLLREQRVPIRGIRIMDREAVSPLVYVPALTGRDLNREGYARCPFHAGGNERTPSLKAYDQDSSPRTGWYCYGCGVGGRARQLAALVLGLGEVRGGRVLLESCERAEADRYLSGVLGVAL